MVLLMRWGSSCDALAQRGARRRGSESDLRRECNVPCHAHQQSKSRSRVCWASRALALWRAALWADRKCVRRGCARGMSRRINTTKGDGAAKGGGSTIRSEETHETLRTAQVGDYLNWSPAPLLPDPPQSQHA